MERFLRGGSLGRSLARNLMDNLNEEQQQQQQQPFEKPRLAEMQEFEGKFLNSDDNSKISLKFSSWKIPQNSLSRVLSFKQNRQFSFPNYKSFVKPIQSPTSSEYGSIASSFNFRASSPPELETSPSSNIESSEIQMKNFLLKKKRRHRRAKSIGDITVTPV